MRELVTEAKAELTVLNGKVRTVLRGSYSHHYRRLLPDLLASLEIRCNNTAHRPVMTAVPLAADQMPSGPGPDPAHGPAVGAGDPAAGDGGPVDRCLGQR